MRPPIQRPRRAVRALCLLAAAASIQADPFATTYTGTIGSAGIPGVASGQGYAVTLVFDNGGSTAASQQWTGAHLTCAIWRMNGDAGSAAVYAQDLAAHPPSLATLSANTDGNGALTGMFNAVTAHNVPPGSYSATPHIEGPVSWFVNGTGPIFSDHNDVAQTRDVFDTPYVGVRLDPTFWSSPQAFAGPCAAPTASSPPTPVPILGHAALALLSGLLGAAGFIGHRRKKV